MRISLVTTTIGSAPVLRKYRELGPDVRFVVAGDLKTPHGELQKLAAEVGNTTYLHPDQQQMLYPQLSGVLGWNTIQRRNIAILEAARDTPDVIVSIDDDNGPKDDTYFADIEKAFSIDHSGAVANGNGWFNIGHYAHEPYFHRGLPYSCRNGGVGLVRHAAARFDKPRQVGVLEGLVYRTPDIDAVERVYRDPEVDWYHQDAREGIAIDPGKTWAPVNSQNTAYRAELAPLMLLPPDLGRFDDIFGSFIAQRVLEATDYCVRFGRPFVVQDRNEHDVYRDLEQELFGMRNTDRFVAALKGIEVDPSASVLDNLGAVLTGLEGCGVDLPHLFFREWLRAWE